MPVWCAPRHGSVAGTRQVRSWVVCTRQWCVGEWVSQFEAYAEAQGRGTRPAPDLNKTGGNPSAEAAPPVVDRAHGRYRTAQVARVIHRWSGARQDTLEQGLGLELSCLGAVDHGAKLRARRIGKVREMPRLPMPGAGRRAGAPASSSPPRRGCSRQRAPSHGR